jgi:hypothetical protein
MRKPLFFRITYVAMIIGMMSMGLSAQKMPDDANKLYQAFSDAINKGDIDGLKNSLAQSSFIKMKNEALSMGFNYPNEVLDNMKQGLPPFSNFTYLKHAKKGSTVNAFYMYGENKSESNIITLCMLEEEGKLKLLEMKMRDAKDFILNLHNKDYSFLDLKEFQPTGIVPVVPKEIEKVDYMGYLDISCYGYKVSATVNGLFQIEVNNKSRSGVIIGGINKGTNTLELVIEKIDPNEKEKPAVGIRAFINQEEKEVFYINEDIVGTITRTFTVN